MGGGLYRCRVVRNRVKTAVTRRRSVLKLAGAVARHLQGKVKPESKPPARRPMLRKSCFLNV
jgi:hypothetical protein